jgi:hypothetical protein
MQIFVKTLTGKTSKSSEPTIPSHSPRHAVAGVAFSSQFLTCSLEQSPSRLNRVILLTTSSPRSRIRRGEFRRRPRGRRALTRSYEASLRTSSASSSPESSWRMVALSLITTSRKSRLFTLSSVSGVACKSSSRLSLEKPVCICNPLV